MTVPAIVQSALHGEEIHTRVSIGGDDELFVADSKCLVYRAEGLLTDESIEELPYDADRLTLSEGRRKSSITLEYSLEGTSEVSIPATNTEDVLRPLLAGVLEANGAVDADESLIELYRFSELTLVLTEKRLLEHVGSAVWDEESQEYHFEDVTNLSFEDGDVATRIVLEVDGRPRRIKTPNDAADDVRERLKRALISYYETDSAELDDTLDESANDADAEPASRADSTSRSRGEASARSRRAVRAQPTENQRAAVEKRQPMADGADAAAADATGEVGRAAVAGQSHDGASREVLERLEALEDAVERQNERLQEQQRTIDRLIEELRQGR
ncbi:DUF7115 domain-containing protein [Natronococcus occultus]|uniref:DUF7115 domain-containing protein n=1 Tax=Natronococcus occultus SP4 TaxID=694430 RepID=L0K3B9_9EURY|nr:hypothetical protein [Natronococcus occultus]AGB39511.1 hypothetical protein Natoc_3804 [Natronococcus occultus SP4]